MMKRVMKSWQGLLIIFILFLVAIGVSNHLFKGSRIDLTENGIYTLELPTLRTYERRVREYLKEYVNHSDGKLSLKVVDPEPFSEAEDEATGAGLQGIPIGTNQDKVYFGLVGRSQAPSVKKEAAKAKKQNVVDQVDQAISKEKVPQAVIPFFQPSKEQFLEYDITKLIYKLSHPKEPVIGVISNLNMNGGYDFRTGRPTPDWVVVQEMKDRFRLRWLNRTVDRINKDIDVLLIVQPQKLSPETQLAIDQFVLSGGRALVFVDPLSEAEGSNKQGINVKKRRSDFSRILTSWGVKLVKGKVVGDLADSMVVSMGANRAPARHIGLLSLKAGNMNQNDVIMNGLSSLTMSSVGVLEPLKGATTTVTPLIKSSNQSELLDTTLWEHLTNPEDLMKNFAATGKEYILAARIRGSVKTAFPHGIVIEKTIMPTKKKSTAHPVKNLKKSKVKKAKKVKITIMPKIKKSKQINVVVVADSDILTDRLWVQKQQFFGEKVLNPWAGNGDFVINALENLAGDNDLISIRNQAKFARPFKKVEALKRAAEARFYQKQNDLENQLSKTEKKLTGLEKARHGKDKALFSKAQDKELASFQQDKLVIRKQLREVQHQLNKDIEALGTRLKLINIFLMPILVSLFAFLMFMIKRRRR